MSFQQHTIPSDQTQQFSTLFLDYLVQHQNLNSFSAWTPDLAGYEKASSALQYNEEIRSTLVAEIAAQYASSGLTASTTLLAQLASAGTQTVTTGHQLCIVTGPMYFITKIATTIRLAETLSQTLNKSIVPIYWMASEDHDVEEIRAVRMYGKTLRWETTQTGPVGDLKTDDLTAFLEELKTVLGTSDAAQVWMQRVEAAYIGATSMADATRKFVHAIFGDRVLLLDANAANLKLFFTKYLRDDLMQHTADGLVRASIAQLEALGYAAQVNPRPINIFYMRDGLRERIEREGAGWRVLNTDITFSETELETELQDHPERFSPNVVLRPLYQQVILPNLAYVGGPGELAYWLEYKAFFDAQHVFFPVLHPRNFAVILDAASLQKMEKWNITLLDLFRHPDELARDFVTQQAGDSLQLDVEKNELSVLYERIAQRLTAADPTLKAAAEGEAQKAKNGLAALEAKLIRAEKQKQETTLNQLKKVREKILPDGTLQERKDNFIPYAIAYGEHFITDFINAQDPMQRGLAVLVPVADI